VRDRSAGITKMTTTSDPSRTESPRSVLQKRASQGRDLLSALSPLEGR